MFFLAKMVRDKASKYKKNYEEGEDEKPFLEHLEDLRQTLFKIIYTLLFVTIGTFIFNKQLLELIQFPLQMANIPEEVRKMSTLGAVEGMMLAIKVSFYAGIILSFPLLMYFLGEFIMPGLKDTEKKLILPSLLVGAGLFAIGVCFSYFFVIPRALEFFYEFSTKRGWGYDLRAGYYISFAVQMVLVFGVSFELPVVVMALVKLEILSHRVMRNTRSTAIVIMVIASALITPTTDVFTLSLLAGPLIILYEICIWLAWWMEWKRAKKEERERKQELARARKLAPPPSETDDGDGDATDGSSKPTKPKTPIVDKDHIDSDHVESSTPVPAYGSDNEFKDPDGEDEHADDDEPDISPEGEVSGVDIEKNDSDSDSSENQDSDTTDNDSDHDSHTGDHGDDYWNDPYHHDDHHHDDYYSGPTEELKRELREELTQQIKAELRHELLVELRREIRVESARTRRLSLDPRRNRRPR